VYEVPGDVETSRIEADMLLGGASASFDWQLALEWLAPMTSSQMEGVRFGEILVS
jgi:hypothetical protein